MFDRESIFQLLVKKDWDEISKILYKNTDILHSDPVIKQAIQLFENEFFSDMEKLNPQEKLDCFEYIGIIIELKKKSFSTSFSARFVDEKLAALRILKKDDLLSFAASHQNRPLAREILNEIKNRKPEIIADALRQKVSIKSTKTSSSAKKTIKLFKSRQEENFFEAILSAFPTYHPYPNVALSCVLDYEEIKNELSQSHKNYFFRAVIDSVVFDASKGYQPMYFIELDSHFHDNDKAKVNDKLKNEIFEIANVKLIRIRAQELSETSVQKYRDLVIEVMREL